MQLWGMNGPLYSAHKTTAFERYFGGHPGIDIATFHRDKVYAAHGGIIQPNLYFDNPTRAGGREVWVYSDPVDGEQPGNSIVCTVYCHLDEIAVKPGQGVSQGDLIGYEGNTGFVISGTTQYWGNAPAGVGTHLHFGVYELVLKGATNWVLRYPGVMKGSVDPLQYLTETPENPYGDISGLQAMLNRMTNYLRSS
jgi:murein DD-endopeptidase MepM/ murein hydrolase activator NlpD